MIKHVKFLAFLSIIMLNKNVQGKPQEIGETAILAFAQVKDTFDNGAAANDKKEFEFLGAKFKNDMAIGFGDAIRTKRSYQLPISETAFELNENSYLNRPRRSTKISDLAKQIMNSKETFRNKRETDENSIEIDNSDDYEYDYSSSYSESEEDLRRKRSISFDQFSELLLFKK